MNKVRREGEMIFLVVGWMTWMQLTTNLEFEGFMVIMFAILFWRD